MLDWRVENRIKEKKEMHFKGEERPILIIIVNQLDELTTLKYLITLMVPNAPRQSSRTGTQPLL